MNSILELDRRFRWLLILAVLQDAALCIGTGIEAGFSTSTVGEQMQSVFLALSGVSLVLLPLSILLTIWGLVMLRRDRGAGRPLMPIAQLTVLLAQIPIILSVIYLIMLALTL